MRNAIIIILLLLVSSLMLLGCDGEEIVIDYTKLTTIDEVPPKIMENIRDLELKHGIWQFKIGEWYESENLYFMLCGGEEFIEGYDVEVKKIVASEQSSEGWKITSVYLHPYISEIHVEESAKYSDGLAYPIVIFRVDTKYGRDDRVGNGASFGDPSNPVSGVDLEIQPNYPPK